MKSRRLTISIGLFVALVFLFEGIYIYRQDYLRPAPGEPFRSPIGEGAAPEQAVPPPLKGGQQPRPSENAQVDLQAAYPGLVWSHGNRTRKSIALSFDDGPDRDYTPKVLDVLKTKRVKATFFLIGQRAQMYQDVLQRIAAEGHDIGNHSWDHPHLSHVVPSDILSEVQTADEMLTRITGRRAAFLRPPYGESNTTILDAARTAGYKLVFWDVDSRDWKSLSAAEIQSRVTANLQPGSIVLFHSASGGPSENLTGTIQALPAIIDYARQQGYKVVPVSELLGLPSTR